MSISKWEIKHKRYVFQSQWSDVSKNTVCLARGNVIDDYYVIENKDSVMIAALDRDNNIILKREYRLPVNTILIELPAGAIEETDKDPLEAAERELLEETGYISSKWLYCGESYDSPDRCTSILHLFIALDAEKKFSQALDDTEDIDILIVKLEEAVQMCLENEISVNSCAKLIFLARERVKRNQFK